MRYTDDVSQDKTQTLTPKWNADGLITAIAIDHVSGAVLMVAHMNEATLKETLSTRNVVYWSRSRQARWRKGETSGDVQKLVEMRIDCDQDAVLVFVNQKGVACHTGRRSCFYRHVDLSEIGKLTFIDDE